MTYRGQYTPVERVDDQRRMVAKPCRYLRLTPGTNPYQDGMGKFIKDACCTKAGRALAGGYVRDICVTTWQHANGGCPFLED
jgi:hypothetical protein